MQKNRRLQTEVVYKPVFAMYYSFKWAQKNVPTYPTTSWSFVEKNVPTYPKKNIPAHTTQYTAYIQGPDNYATL